jgi:hypothetical protein
MSRGKPLIESPLQLKVRLQKRLELLLHLPVHSGRTLRKENAHKRRNLRRGTCQMTIPPHLPQVGCLMIGRQGVRP